MDGEYVGGDGSEGEGGNVESFVTRRAVLVCCQRHCIVEVYLPNASKAYEGSACLPT